MQRRQLVAWKPPCDEEDLGSHKFFKKLLKNKTPPKTTNSVVSIHVQIKQTFEVLSEAG